MASSYADSEQADVDGIDKALQCLSDAEKALKTVRAHEVKERDTEGDEDEETPASKQPSDLKGAAKETRKRFAQARGRKPAY